MKTTFGSSQKAHYIAPKAMSEVRPPPPLIARRTMCCKRLSDFAENIMTYGDNQKIYTVCYKNIEKDLTRSKKSPATVS